MNHRIDRLRQRARGYVNGGQVLAAVTTLESLLREQPEDDAARLDLSLAQLHLGRYCQAHAQTMRACNRHLEDTALARARIEALRAFAEQGRLRELLGQMVALDAIEPHDLVGGASALLAVGEAEAASRWVEAALKQSPGDVVARVIRAMSALDRGMREPAEADLEAVLGAGHCVPMAHWLLAMLRRQTPQGNHVARLRQTLDSTTDGSEDQARLAFALHKELDDLDQPSEAWNALQCGLRAKRRHLAYDEAAEVDLFARLPQVFAGPFPQPVIASAHSSVPIFIVGMHRSGTSLLERILEAHPRVAVGGESQRLSAQLRLAVDHHIRGPIDAIALQRLSQVDLGEFGRNYLQAHAWLLAGRSHFTEKLPDNYLLIGLIRQVLPEAKVLHLVRDPMQTCWSNLRELYAGQAMPFSYEQRCLGRHYVRYRSLMQHWQRIMPGFVCDVSYTDLVRDPERCARRVFEFCELDWIPGCTAVERLETPVRSASAMQVREPIHARSLERWRRYASWLEPLRETLAEAGIDA